MSKAAMMNEYEQQAMNVTENKVIDHEQFLNRIRKTLYYGSTLKCTKISRPLADYAADMFSETHRGHSLSRLNFVTVGNLTVTPCSLILAMIYLDRINIIDPAYARRITPSELFIVSMMVSTKFYCGYDEDIYLSAWAESGNISVEHMKELELEFLDAIGWNVYVSNQEFFEKLKCVEKVLAKRQGVTRGWLTYTELINFLPTMTLAKQILNYSTVIALSYTASVMTIAGAFFFASNINVPGNLLFRANSSKAPTAATGAVPSCNVRQSSLANQNSTCTHSSAEASEQSLLLEECEFSLHVAIASIQMMNRGYFNDNSKTEDFHHKADFTRSPMLTNDYGATINWKKFRFIYPTSIGNGGDSDDGEDDTLHESISNQPFGHSLENENGTRDEFIPFFLTPKERLQCDTTDNDQQETSRIYVSYKRTFEMFSSFLKFL